MALTLEQLNSALAEEAAQMLDGLYEHSPWIAERALKVRPFQSLPHLKNALVKALAQASQQEQLGLIRAHPELAGKAMVSKTLTAESTNEQSKAGLTDCTPEEFERLHKLNADYNIKFGFPFILSVRGPRGTGLSRAQIIETFTGPEGELYLEDLAPGAHHGEVESDKGRCRFDLQMPHHDAVLVELGRLACLPTPDDQKRSEGPR